MKMNPMQLLKMKENFDKFRERHPKFWPFLKTAIGKMEEGSILEVKLTNPDGHTATTNIKIGPEDLKVMKGFFK